MGVSQELKERAFITAERPYHGKKTRTRGKFNIEYHICNAIDTKSGQTIWLLGRENCPPKSILKFAAKILQLAAKISKIHPFAQANRTSQNKFAYIDIAHNTSNVNTRGNRSRRQEQMNNATRIITTLHSLLLVVTDAEDRAALRKPGNVRDIWHSNGDLHVDLLGGRRTLGNEKRNQRLHSDGFLRELHRRQA